MFIYIYTCTSLSMSYLIIKAFSLASCVWRLIPWDSVLVAAGSSWFRRQLAEMEKKQTKEDEWTANTAPARIHLEIGFGWWTLCEQSQLPLRSWISQTEEGCETRSRPSIWPRALRSNDRAAVFVWRCFKKMPMPRIRWSWDVLRSSSMACWFMAWMTFLFPVVQVTLPCALRYLHRRKGSGTARGLRSSRRLDPPGSLLKLERHVVGQASSSSWW